MYGFALVFMKNEKFAIGVFRLFDPEYFFTFLVESIPGHEVIDGPARYEVRI